GDVGCAGRATGAPLQRRALRPLSGDVTAGSEFHHPDSGWDQQQARRAGAGVLIASPARDHRGQSGGQHRHGVVLPDHNPRAAAYEVANYLQAIDQLTVTTLRNVIGSMDLERTLTSREEI